MQDALTHVTGLIGALAAWACPVAWLWLGLIGPVAGLACLVLGLAVVGAAAFRHSLGPTAAPPPLGYAFAAAKPRRAAR
jgi:hypothetical protein